jgi:sugar lactone lactonase YvrE
MNSIESGLASIPNCRASLRSACALLLLSFLCLASAAVGAPISSEPGGGTGGGTTIGGGTGGGTPPDPDPDPQLTEDLRLGVVRPDQVTLAVELAGGFYQLHRQKNLGTWLHLQDWITESPAQTTFTSTGLEEGEHYCWRLTNLDTGSTHLACTIIPFARLSFDASRITPEESARVLAEFNWFRTDPIFEGGSPPALYYMNVLVESREDVRGLSAVGIHIQQEPLFPDELDGWSSLENSILEGDSVTGAWYYAVVPGYIYNELRSVSRNRIASGEEPTLRALVFRRLRVPDAMADVGDVHRLSYAYLGENGFEYDSSRNEDECSIDEAEGIVCAEPVFLGWLLRKGLEVVFETTGQVVQAVRDGLGYVQRFIFGESPLKLQIRVKNTDENFGTDHEMMSAWRHAPLRLSNHIVRIKQGLGTLPSRTDLDGNLSTDVAAGLNFSVCVTMENKYVKITQFLMSRTICSSRYSLPESGSAAINIRHPHLNVYMQINDAAFYMKEVMQYEMRKIVVLVGPSADLITYFNGGRAFAACQSSFPGSVASVVSLLGFGTQPLLIAAEFLTSVDIVLPGNSDESRGVAVHEYGHAVLCDMIRSRSGYLDHSAVWLQATYESIRQRPGDETGYINEAFADFLSAQVVGATNYFFTSNDQVSQEYMYYCDAGSNSTTPCVERNFSDSAEFGDQVARIATLLHDAFDAEAPCDPEQYFNDGTHWDLSGVDNVLYEPAFQEGEDLCDAVLDDERIELPRHALVEVLKQWGLRAGTIPELNEEKFLGGLADVMKSYGFGGSEICELWNLHGTECPSWIDPSDFSGYRCSDGLDNDGNGLADFPADPGCSASTDDLEYDAQPGDLLVSDFDNARINLVNPDTGDVRILFSGAPLVRPWGLTLDQHGALLVSDFGGGVIRLDLQMGTTEVVSSGGFLSAPRGIATTRSGAILVADSPADAIVSIDAFTGEQTILAPGTGGNEILVPAGLVVADDGMVFATDRDTGVDRVVAFDPASGEVFDYSSSSIIGEPWGLTFDQNGDLLVVDSQFDQIVRVDGVSGAESPVLWGWELEDPRNIAIEPTGTWIITDGGGIQTTNPGEVYRLDPITGTQTLVTDAIDNPSGLAIIGGGPPDDAEEPSPEETCTIDSEDPDCNGVDLTVVPEPDQLAMLMAGIAFLSGTRRRRWCIDSGSAAASGPRTRDECGLWAKLVG